MDGSIIPYRVNGVENLVSYLFSATQFIDIGLPLALGNMQSIFLRQVKTSFSVAVEIIPVGDCLGMIIYSAEHDMTVWIILVEMTDNNVWSINDTHFLHIFLGNLGHNKVINFILVVSANTVSRKMQGETLF